MVVSEQEIGGGIHDGLAVIGQQLVYQTADGICALGGLPPAGGSNASPIAVGYSSSWHCYTAQARDNP